MAVVLGGCRGLCFRGILRSFSHAKESIVPLTYSRILSLRSSLQNVAKIQERTFTSKVPRNSNNEPTECRVEDGIEGTTAVTTQRQSQPANHIVLGIETSCDDTGAAVVDGTGSVLGEALNSQTAIHLRMGGIIPPYARDLHVENIEEVVTSALTRANVTLQDLDAIAVTTRPGLALSLRVGLDHALKLVRDSGRPLISIHHMQAHALTARINNRIEFPFLVLLVSGGHCILTVAEDVDKFVLLGRGLDEAPGDALDKVARRLKLKNLPEYSTIPGGAAIELMALRGDPMAVDFPQNVMGPNKNCDFSFAGIHDKANRFIQTSEEKFDLAADGILPNAADICASLQYCILRHLAKRLQRALVFCDMKGLLPEQKTLVVSGGVASNMFLRQGLEKVCDKYSCHLICPPPKLCTDNGIMIAWNGIEKLKLGKDMLYEPWDLQVEPKYPIGADISREVAKMATRLDRIKLI